MRAMTGGASPLAFFAITQEMLTIDTSKPVS